MVNDKNKCRWVPLNQPEGTTWRCIKLRGRRNMFISHTNTLFVPHLVSWDLVSQYTEWPTSKLKIQYTKCKYFSFQGAVSLPDVFYFPVKPVLQCMCTRDCTFAHRFCVCWTASKLVDVTIHDCWLSLCNQIKNIYLFNNRHGNSIIVSRLCRDLLGISIRGSNMDEK